MVIFGGHNFGMVRGYLFNRGQLERRVKMAPSTTRSNPLSNSRQPFLSSLTLKEKLIIAKRQKRIAIKRKKMNRIILITVTVFSMVLVTGVGIRLLMKLNVALDQQEVVTYSGQIHWYSDVDYDSPDWDYSPLAPE